MKSPRLCGVVMVVGVLLGGAWWWLNHNTFAGGGKTTIAQGVGEAGSPPCQNPPAAAKPLLAQSYGRLPLYFIENRGQVDQQVKYYTRGKGHTTFFTREGLVLTLARGEKENRNEAGRPGPGAEPAARKEGPRPVQDAVVRLQPVGMQKKVKLKALEPQECKVNYFIGNDPKKWRTNIPTYAGVLYQEAYAGIDLKFYGHGRQMEYDIVAQAGADPGQVRFAYQGVERLEVTPAGDLALHLPDGGVLVQRKPVVYQEIAGQRVAREGKFLLQPGTARLVFGFEVASYDKAYPLVIDPVLVYSTYLGGGLDDVGLAIAVDKSGRALVTGWTKSIDFPTQYAFSSANQGKKDVFVTQFKSDGSGLVFSTYLGGDDDDEGRAIAVDETGNLHLTGQTYSDDFPVKNALLPNREGSFDAFVTKLDPNGGSLVFSTYLGGTQTDTGRGIAVDRNHNVYVTGNTQSNDFPQQAALYPTYQGSKDAFVSKFSPTGSLLFSTFLGGTKADDGASIAVSPAGQIYVTGNTNSADFPISHAIYNSIKVTPDAFVTSIKADLSGLAFSTFLGGNGSDYGNSVTRDNTGHIYVGGYTYSTDFPIHHALFPSSGGKADAFLSKIQADGSGLVYSTYLGGGDADHCYAIAVDGSDEVSLTGVTASSNFPIKNALFPNLKGTYDAFVTRLRADGQGLIYSTFLGGNEGDQGIGLAVDRGGQVHVTGETNSVSFPVKSALYATKKGGSDAFVTKIRQPAGSVFLELLLGE